MVDTVLVVGGAGYIGSHTTLAFREAGVRVVVYDDLSAGHREAVLGAPLVEADVHDVDTLRRTLREHEVGAVLHFAGRLSVPESLTDPAGVLPAQRGRDAVTAGSDGCGVCRRAGVLVDSGSVW